jgi:hypothetical protein
MNLVEFHDKITIYIQDLRQTLTTRPEDSTLEADLYIPTTQLPWFDVPFVNIDFVNSKPVTINMCNYCKKSLCINRHFPFICTYTLLSVNIKNCQRLINHINSIKTGSSIAHNINLIKQIINNFREEL